ncbi:MAG: DUF5752 family protein [Candidatus Aenigmatarchaeota archaeon]
MSKNVADNEAFWFSTEEGSVGFVAHTTKELKEAFRKVPMKSIKFHLREDRNDFESWLRNVMEEHAVADDLVNIKEDFTKGSLKGVALRKTLVKTLKN